MASNCLSGQPFKKIVVLAFFFIAFPTGTMLAILTPPGQVPDEQAHVARALGLLHGAVIGVRKPGFDEYTHQRVTRTGVKVDRGLFDVVAAPVTLLDGNPIVTKDNFEADQSARSDHTRIYVDLPNTATYFPLTYLPAMLGLEIGLVVHAAPFTSFLLARFFMLGAFLVFGGMALSFAAYGEAVLLTILLLPMTLFLAGSVSQDAIIIAITCLACALISKNDRVSWRIGLLLFVVVVLSKPPYAPLLVTFLLPLSRVDFWRKAREMFLASIPVLVWVGIVIAFVIVPYPIPLYHPGPLYHGDASVWLDHGDPTGNFHILLSKPIRFFTIPWRTEQIWFSGLAQELIGVLGLVRIGLPMVYYYAWGTCLVAALSGLLLCPRLTLLPPGAAVTNFLITSAAIILTYWLIMILFYVNYTDAGGATITGLQGRYFLPLLPYLLFTLPSLRLRFKLAPIIPAVPTILLGIYGIGYLPMTIVKSYYLH